MSLEFGPARQKNTLDEVIDDALKSYSAVEPRQGFEERLIHRLRDVEIPQASPTRSVWMAAAIGVAAAVCVTAIVILPPVSHRKPGSKSIASSNETLGRSQNVTAQQNPGREKSLAVATHRRALRQKMAPQQKRQPRHLESPALATAQFPSPAPLTQEERLMLKLVQVAPQAALADSAGDLAPSKELEVAPLEVPALAIKPLADEGETG